MTEPTAEYPSVGSYVPLGMHTPRAETVRDGFLARISECRYAIMHVI